MSELMRIADIVGLVRAEPVTYDIQGTWQGISIQSIEPVKGRLPRRDHDPRYPWMTGKPTENAARPTWLTREGFYLVFLRRGTPDKPDYWPMLAAYRVDYRPDARGRITGALAGGDAEMSSVRRLIARVANRGSAAKDAAAQLNGWLASAARAMAHEPATQEAMLAEVRKTAAAIRPNTSRSDVEKVFLQQDGGLSGLDATRYYAGHDVMVEVPYDRSGRVSGPLKVYRSEKHLD